MHGSKPFKSVRQKQNAKTIVSGSNRTKLFENAGWKQYISNVQMVIKAFEFRNAYVSSDCGLIVTTLILKSWSRISMWMCWDWRRSGLCVSCWRHSACEITPIWPNRPHSCRRALIWLYPKMCLQMWVFRSVYTITTTKPLWPLFLGENDFTLCSSPTFKGQNGLELFSSRYRNKT